MLTDEPHSTHSGTGLVDTPNKTGSFIEVAYDAPRAGPHRVTVRYTHIKPDPRPGQLWINGKDGPILPMPQGRVLPAFRTDSAVVTLPQGRNLIRLVALAEKSGVPLDKVSDEAALTADKAFTKGWREVFSLKRGFAARENTGMPGPKAVAREIARWKQSLR